MDDIELIQQTLAEHGYQYIKLIGQGGFSNVYLCHSPKYNLDFAIKRTTKNRLTQDEYNTLVSLDHPNIIKLYDAFNDEFAQYLVMEYCQKGPIKPKMSLSYDQFINYARQLLGALSFCHSKKITHRDIKPENILFDQYDNCKLADFGIAKIFIDDKSDEKCGTIRYFAPEMFQCEDFCPFKADIWALGITFYCFATGTYPFHGKTKKDIKQSISIGELNFDKYNVDKRIRFLILKMTQLSPSLRVAPDKLLNLSMFSHQSANKKQSSSSDNRCHMITSKSTSFEDLARYSASDSKKIPPKRNLNSCKCVNFFPTPHKSDRHCQIPKPQ